MKNCGVASPRLEITGLHCTSYPLLGRGWHGEAVTGVGLQTLPMPSQSASLTALRVGTKASRFALLAPSQVPAQLLRLLDSATGGAPLQPQRESQERTASSVIARLRRSRGISARRRYTASNRRRRLLASRNLREVPTKTSAAKDCHVGFPVKPSSQ